MTRIIKKCGRNTSLFRDIIVLAESWAFLDSTSSGDLLELIEQHPEVDDEILELINAKESNWDTICADGNNESPDSMS